jgi:hypothetical protein
MIKLELNFGEGFKIFCFTLSLFLLLMLSGCKTAKTAISSESNIQKDSTSVVDTKIQVENVDSTSQQLNKQTASVDSSQTKITDIFFSKPDSTGKQYIERITTTDISRVNSILTNMASSTMTNTSAKVKVDKKAKTQVKSTAKTKADTVIKETPVTKWPLLILAVGILIGGYFILKRFKLF